MANIVEYEILNGTFGEVYIDGEFYGNFNEIEVKISNRYSEVIIPGQRQVKHKHTAFEATGTLRGFSVGPGLVDSFVIRDDDVPPALTIEAYIKDPEGAEKKKRFNNVKPTNFTLMSFKTGELVPEEWEFYIDGPIEDIEIDGPIEDIE